MEEIATRDKGLLDLDLGAGKQTPEPIFNMYELVKRLVLYALPTTRGDWPATIQTIDLPDGTVLTATLTKGNLAVLPWGTIESCSIA